MLGRSNELPLAHDGSNRYLPWIIAFMTYLAVLALAGAMVLGTAMARWGGGLVGTLTVQIIADGESEADTARLVANAVEVLRATPGVVKVRPLEREEIVALMEPWLGSGSAAEDLPLPRLIDVTVDKVRDIDQDALAQRLAEAAPGATLDDHRKWLADLLKLARSVELITAGIVLLTALVAALTVVFAARAGLELHHHVIELLHLIGARDSYVARQFQYHALWLGLRGGLLGLALAIPSLYGLARLAGRIDSPIVPDLTLSQLQWAALAAVPLGTALIAMVTARLTVLRTLARMP